MSAWHPRLLRASVLLSISLICAVATLPATWFMRLLPPQALLGVVAADGSVWSGTAMLRVGQMGYARSIAPPIQWQTHWSPLPVVTIRHPWLSHPVTLSLHWQGVSVSSATLQIPAHLLSSIDARLAALELGGQFTLQWPASIVPLSGWMSSDVPLTLQWTHASTVLSHVSPLGTYRLTFSPDATDRFKLQLSTVAGPVIANGSGYFSAPQGLSFTGHATIDPLTSGTDKVSLNELLALIGPSQQGQTILRAP